MIDDGDYCLTSTRGWDGDSDCLRSDITIFLLVVKIRKHKAGYKASEEACSDCDYGETD